MLLTTSALKAVAREHGVKALELANGNAIPEVENLKLAIDAILNPKPHDAPSNKMKNTLINVSSLKEALEIHFGAVGEKVLGIECGAHWNFEDSYYYAESHIGDWSTYAIARVEIPIKDYKTAPSRGEHYESECSHAGDLLIEELRKWIGEEWDLNLELS